MTGFTIWNIRPVKQVLSVKTIGASRVFPTTDGSAVVTTFDDGHIRTYNSATGAVVADCTSNERVHSIDYASHGKFIIGLSEGKDDTVFSGVAKSVNVWDLSGVVVKHFDMAGSKSLMVSTDGVSADVTGEDGSIKTIDLNNFSVKNTRAALAGKVQDPHRIPDASSAFSQFLERNFEQPKSIKLNSAWTKFLADNQLRIGSYSRDGRLAIATDGKWQNALWNTSENKIVKKLGSFADFTPDGNVVIVDGNDSKIGVFNIADGQYSFI